MQIVPQPQWDNMVGSDVLPWSHGVRISFDKAYDDNVTFFTLNQSQLNGGDLLAPSDDNVIQAWDFYDYKNYTDRVTHMSWDRTLEFPYSVASARADFELSNTDNYFTPGGSSPIEQYILPKRPVRLLSGLRSILLPQFVGLTQGMPDVSEQSKTASFTALDFLTQIYDMPIRSTIALRDVRTDEVLENIFLQFGLSPSQFDLAKARNTIPFVFFERDQQTAGEVIRKLMEAEMGLLWLGEDGIIRFRPRLEVPKDPAYELNGRDIVSINISSDTQIINTVRITNRVREVQQYQDVFKITNDTRPGGVIPASSSRVYSAELQDPCLTIEDPTRGAQSGVSWFVAKTATGVEVTSGITVIATELRTNSFDITFANTNNFPVQITDMQLFGQPAKIINPNDPEIIFDYPPSIDKYEIQPSASVGDEGGLAIENNFIQTFSQAQSLAVTILDDYAEHAAIIDCEINGNPALQLADIVELDYKQYTGQYRVIGMSMNLQGGRFVQNLKLRSYTPRDWFQLNVSQLNGSGVLAP